ncbi:TetR family transcriptional regulator [Rhodococcus ruber BKS 20-38]|uniref:TetR family transcriptional regulator n=1 Tax=Rhodococcus ruber BKS 20-38 TaxID=1278076 RepID=M2Z025_9NOCA|nr:TetR family transcriptional regulator [Rhodococcus ruber]EME54288.1 TetR family transcriptional regulator [Rhodococcus ruber BKS 20-38]
MGAPGGSVSQERVPSLRERRRLETRREITLAALELFERQGAAATTVDEIARRAGVSPSTFFRYFATKEESVYGPDRDFEADLLDWLDSVSPAQVDLEGLEALYERSLRRLMASSDDAKDHVLRTRRLVASDDHIRAAAFAVDAVAMSRVTQSVTEKIRTLHPPSYARLLVEIAAAAARTAFETWIDGIEGGGDIDLVESYRRTRTEIRKIFGAEDHRK